MDKISLKLLTRIFLFTLLISYSVDKFVFFSLNYISDQVMTGQAIGKLNQFLSVKDSVNFIVFGNSRANNHINPTLFHKNSFNMGVNGTEIAYYSSFIRQPKIPPQGINTLDKDTNQLIVVHLDTNDLFDVDYDGSDIRGLKAKFKRNNNITNALKRSGHLSPLHYIFYSMNYNGSILGIAKNYIKPNYDYKKYRGYDPLILNRSQEIIRNKILSNEQKEDCLDNLEANSLALYYLKEITEFIKSSKKEFLFITSPIYNDYCSSDNKILSEIMRKNNLTYWDFTNYFTNANEMSLWKDELHLSQKGAEKFSKFLMTKINEKYNFRNE